MARWRNDLIPPASISLFVIFFFDDLPENGFIGSWELLGAQFVEIGEEREVDDREADVSQHGGAWKWQCGIRKWLYLSVLLSFILTFFLPFKTWIEMIKGTYAAVESENAFCPQQLTGDAQRWKLLCVAWNDTTTLSICLTKWHHC